MSLEKAAKRNKFNNVWTEKDEALFYDLVKRKISDINFELKECQSPFMRSRLKVRKKEYQDLLRKIEQGTYNSSILAAEMAAYKGKLAEDEFRRQERFAKGKYVDSYSEIDFDFDSYFRQTRYFGAALPMFMLIFTMLVLVVMVFSIVLPRQTTDNIDSMLQSAMPDNKLSLSSLCYMKLSYERDFIVPNDGLWPKGTYMNPENALENGEYYIDSNGNMPEQVLLYSDLGMVSIDITTMDVLKAFFYTPLMQKYEISFIEEQLFTSESDNITWYYRFFIMGNEDSLKIERNADGDWETLNIVHTVGTYGTTFTLFISILLLLFEVLICIFRLFSYTSRRFHFLPLLIILCLLMTAIFPIFAGIEDFTWKEISANLKSYFTLSWETFLESESMISINFVIIIAIGLMALTMLLPLFFKNKAIKKVTYVPKGNRPHTFGNQKYPTKPQGIPSGYVNPKYNIPKQPRG